MKKLIAGIKITGLNIKKLNVPLIIGLIIIAALIVFSIYPEVFTPSDPYGKERQEFVFIDGKINLFSPPVEPCAEYPWGTDVYGRDSDRQEQAGDCSSKHNTALDTYYCCTGFS
ncbi:MAG: hypothetical protein ACYCYE_07980 [Clostridia bacterium]